MLGNEYQLSSMHFLCQSGFPVIIAELYAIRVLHVRC